MHQLVIKRFQHCLMHGVTMKFEKVYTMMHGQKNIKFNNFVHRALETKFYIYFVPVVDSDHSRELRSVYLPSVGYEGDVLYQLFLL